MEGHKITMIVGLPGAGMTTLAKKLARESEFVTLVADDFSKRVENYISEFNPNVHKHLIVTDSMLIFADQANAELTILEMLQLLPQDVEFEWIYFENDLAACLSNTKRHISRQEMNTVESLAEHYNIPEGAKVLPVYRTLH